jgi:hypothetical protein
MEYRDYISENLHKIKGINNLNTPETWVDRLPGHPETKFESMFREQDKEIFYFKYRKTEKFDEIYRKRVLVWINNVPKRMNEMPHVVFDQTMEVKKVAALFDSLEWRDEKARYKVTNIWLSFQKEAVLLECILVYDGHDELFFVEIKNKAAGCILKISPLREVERDELIFLFLAGLTRRILQEIPDMSVSRHNLGQYFPV